MFTRRGRPPAIALGFLLAGSLALIGCGTRAETGASPSGGCAEALAARAEALASVDASMKIAAERNAARAPQLQGIAREAADELAQVADLAPCEDESSDTGLVVDLAELRTRYSVVLERTQSRLDQTAAQPVVAPAQDGSRGKGKGKDDEKDEEEDD